MGLCLINRAAARQVLFLCQRQHYRYDRWAKAFLHSSSSWSLGCSQDSDNHNHHQQNNLDKNANISTLTTDKTAATALEALGDDEEQTQTQQQQHHKRNSCLYLHIGPSGDCWTGTSIFAAKHLQPDYVKSIPLQPPAPPLLLLLHQNEMTTTTATWTNQALEHLVERLEQDPKLAQRIYDQTEIPQFLWKELLLLQSHPTPSSSK